MLVLLLILIPLLGALGSLVASSQRLRELLNVVTSAGLAVVATFVCSVVAQGNVLTTAGGFIRIDALSALVILLTSYLAVPCAVYAVGYFRRDRAAGRVTDRQLRLYYVLAPLFVCAMVFVPMVDNLGVMWVAMESTTLASVLLVTFYNQKTSFEAGWKYIIIGSVGITLALFGTIITYSSAVGLLGGHAERGLNWSVLSGIADRLNPTSMRIAFVLVLLGYGTKAGLAPMHTWKPDAYAEAPVPAATLMGAAFINCAIYSIMRFSVLAEKSLGHQFPSALLIGFGVFSILLAAPFVLVQRNFRRLLAYSSIDHAGIMVAAIGFGGRWGALGALLHMVFHAVSKPLVFFAAGNVQQTYGTPYLRKVGGVIKRLPVTGVGLMLGVFAVTGLPPFGIFQSEFTILSAALGGQHPLAAALFIFGVVVIFCGFLVHAARMNLGPGPEVAQREPESLLMIGPIIALLICAVTTGLWLPGPLLALIRNSAVILGGAP